MTREEVIRWFKESPFYDKDHEPFNMAIKALEQEPEPIYFPPCVDCQNRSKEIIIAYENMKKMQTYTKEEVITMLDKLRTEIEQITDTMGVSYNQYVSKIDVLQIIDKYITENEGKK